MTEQESKTVPWIDANGVSIHYEVAGAGPTVVLLHEMGGTLDSWDGVAPELSRRYRTLRYDQRGAGLSEKCWGAPTPPIWSRTSAAPP
jgi:3-oxoadipate enol-lactonase